MRRLRITYMHLRNGGNLRKIGSWVDYIKKKSKVMLHKHIDANGLGIMADTRIELKWEYEWMDKDFKQQQ